jgi:hypothetical protein
VKDTVCTIFGNLFPGESFNSERIMPLKRASCQHSASLETFYKEFAASDEAFSKSMGEQMLSLLPMLSQACAPFDVWGLTSMHHLWLLAADDWRSSWLVCVTALPAEGYRIQYRMPQADAPWPNAFIQGIAPDEATACRRILIAMKRSGGWE